MVDEGDTRAAAIAGGVEELLHWSVRKLSDELFWAAFGGNGDGA